MERKCADTIGTVPVPWAGHLQCENINTFSNKIYGSKFLKTALGNCYGLKLPKCWLQFQKNINLLRYIFIIFGTLSFPDTRFERLNFPTSRAKLCLKTIYTLTCFGWRHHDTEHCQQRQRGHDDVTRRCRHRDDVTLRTVRRRFDCSQRHAGHARNESVPIQLAQCRFPAGLAISNAKILIYFLKQNIR